MSSFGSVARSLKMAFGVSGSGDAKMSASRMDFSSALATLGISPSGPSGPSCHPAVGPSGTRGFLSSMVVFRIADRMRGIRRPRSFVYADRPEASRLKHAHELQPNHFEQCQERHDEAAAIVNVSEQILEAACLGLRQAREQLI